MLQGVCTVLQADKVIRELQSNNRLLKSELQATATTFKKALHVAQTMLDSGAIANHLSCAVRSSLHAPRAR